VIVALAEIGRLLEGGEGLSELVEPLKADDVVEVHLARVDQKLAVVDVRLAAFDASDSARYLYRKGPANAAGPSPSYALSGPDPKSKRGARTAGEKAVFTVERKLGGYFQGMAAGAREDSGRSLASEIASALEDPSVVERVAKLADEAVGGKTKRRAILAVVVDGRYPEQVPEISRYFCQMADPSTGKLGGNDAVGGPGQCACCGQEKDKLFACRPQTLGWFSLDKPQYAAGGQMHGLEGNGRWIVFPVCAACALAVRKGAGAVDRRLKFNWSGMRFLIVPDLANWNSPVAATFLTSLESLQNDTSPEAQHDREMMFARRIARDGIVANVNYLFFDQVQSRVVLVAAIQNVLPSQLSRVAAAADRTAGTPLFARFGEWSRAGIEAIRVDFRLFFSLHRAALRGTKYEAVRDGFLASARRVLHGRPFDRGAFFATTLEFIRSEVRDSLASGREPDLRLPVHAALAAAFWLVELGLLPPGAGAPDGVRHIPGDPMTAAPKTNDPDFDSKLDAFFEAFGSFFHNDAQKVCYLMGLLCAQVLSAQRKRLDNRQPFFRNLKDLALDEAEMRALYPQMKQKLVEYERDHFCWRIEEAIARRFRSAGSPWRLPKSEINFFFSLGLSEAGLFIPSKEADDQ